ncbi:MAG: alkaline phosphatase [Alphaproteobacteria bacterium]|nr:alkaline phosphatase [Alphaproteobacteria bacterium]
MLRSIFAALITGACVAGTTAAWTKDRPFPQKEDPYFLRAQRELDRNLALRPNTSRAKNIILFIGDGMGISTVTAARIYQGQREGRDGVSNILTFENLPYSALSRTFSHDSQVTDSAPSATAMTTGIKTRNGVINVSSEAIPKDCVSGLAHPVTTIAELAEEAGMSTGAVTTTRITHATPAAVYAHTTNRDWEGDDEGHGLTQAQKDAGCKDIARQLVEMPYGDGLEVAMGGGRREFLPLGADDPEYPDDREKKGERRDRRDLTAAWLKRYGRSGAYVWNKEQFDAVEPTRVRHLLALFEYDHMHYELDRADDVAGEPSLAQMTRKAISILGRNPRGFFLMVEGGRIDHAHHENKAARALADTVAFDNAVRAAMSATDPKDTLIVVTADHSHVLTISGYPDRDNPILGPVVEHGKVQLARDGKAYTTLSYANGPSAKVDDERDDPHRKDTEDNDYQQESLVPLRGETHSGEDVAIYATGPWAHLFRGTVDENYIFHVMNYAGRIRERAERMMRTGSATAKPARRHHRHRRHR